MRSPDNLRGRWPPLEVHAAAELARRLLGPGLHPELQPHPLVTIDPEHDRVVALCLEDEAVEIERQGRRPLAVRRGEGRLERGLVTEQPWRAVRVEQRDAQRVRPRLVR